MKRCIFFFFFFLLYSITNAQSFKIESKLGKLFSGYGDQHGYSVDVGLCILSKKQYFTMLSFGVGHSSQIVFNNDELQNIENLLVLDRYTENYPFLYFDGIFDFGVASLDAPNNFTNFLFSRLLIGKKFSLSKKLEVSTSVGLGIQKVEATYITSRIPSKISNIYTDFDVRPIDAIITIPFIQSFIEIPYIIDLSFSYKISKLLSLGIFGNTSKGAITVSNYGVHIGCNISK